MACILKDSGRRWDGPIIPFTIDANLTDPQRVLQAMAAWENVSGVRFVARASQNDYVHFRHGQNACHSDTGRIGGRQFITIEPSCSVAGIIHEVGHTIGLKHEHQRPDRDDFVTVHVNNVQAERAHNFEKLSASSVITTTVYDFQSIMHYSSTTFSKDPSMLRTIDGNHGEVLDNSTSPMPLDAQLVNESYHSYVGVVRRSDSGVDDAGAVGGIAVASMFPNRLITAVQTGGGKLKLIMWTVSSVGGITRVSDSGDQAGEASHIAIAAGQRAVTAVRTGAGKLKLISWDLVNDQIQRAGDSGAQAGEASVIQIINLTPTLFLTGCRSGSGRLLLISWTLNPDGSLTRLEDSGNQAGEVSEISLSLVRPRVGTAVPTALVATTVRTGSGNAMVITWQVVLADGSITRIADSGHAIGESTHIASAVAPTGHLVVSCRTGSGNLKLFALVVSDTGDNVARVADSGKQAGEIGLNVMVARPNGVLSAVSAGPPGAALKLINWRVDGEGSINRSGDSSDQAGAVSMIALGIPAQTNAPLVTAVRRGDGNLALISWDDNSAHGEV
jgi:astacin (peptidase family M12A)